MDTTEEQDQLYKIQLLQAFSLEEWDNDVITDTIEELYLEMQEDVQFQRILSTVSKIEAYQFLISMAQEQCTEAEKQIVVFNLLFQYEYFDLMHKCIINFREKKSISVEVANALLKV
jgi:hypothetical protein